MKDKVKLTNKPISNLKWFSLFTKFKFLNRKLQRQNRPNFFFPNSRNFNDAFPTGNRVLPEVYQKFPTKKKLQIKLYQKDGDGTDTGMITWLRVDPTWRERFFFFLILPFYILKIILNGVLIITKAKGIHWLDEKINPIIN